MNYRDEAKNLQLRLNVTHDWCTSGGKWVELPMSVRMVIIAGIEKTEERIESYIKLAEKEEAEYAKD
ncbi:hypothetical protein [Oceanobacillus sp. J11TS1]|uniref:hypothetical protein n=1 Tax=Oceanobacillus sp. J11TS1 TaxID=2807191 RepID=UPI001B0127E5|nr:hypothetical protein [Oceanobacillus sp. J11TS1]GIO22463.1 hypothetical protein J11TS1_10440 [Oceanobacillus sp. J11TS1]